VPSTRVPENVTDPFEVLSEKVRDVASSAHLQAHDMGFERDIKAMPEGFEYSRSFFRRFYRPENVVLLVVGDIAIDKTMDLIRKYYGGGRKDMPPQRAARTSAKGRADAEVVYQGKTLPLSTLPTRGGVPSCEPHIRRGASHGDLAFGVTSDLYRNCISRTSVSCARGKHSLQRDMPLFEIYARVKKEEECGCGERRRLCDDCRFQKTPVDAKRLG